MSPQPSLSPQEFVAKWKHATLKERSAAQEHFIDVCRLVGHPTPGEMDPDGSFFCFEAGASKQTGGQGWADVWYRHHFAWEYKGKDADLDKAYGQLLQYREALENPPLLVVSDIDTICIHTNFTNTVKEVYKLTLEDLTDPRKLRIIEDLFRNPANLEARQTPAQVTERAAAEFGRLAEQLRSYGDGYTNEEIAHFLIRLLFCLFAEDVGLLPEDLFSTLLQRTKGHSKEFQERLQQLFGAMREGGWFGYDRILHFNGHLFDNDRALELDGDGMHTLARISHLDWSSIEPSIFGTLFERSLDPSKRSQLGAHYTSKEDIALIVEPVLMAPLRRRWEEVKVQAAELIEKRDNAPTRSEATKAQNALNSLLQGFTRELASIRVLDPACGSGNFLYVALRMLLDLEKEVGLFGGQLSYPTVSPEQLHGIEINPYAYELAQVTIWIGYIQWMKDNGFGFPSEPILKPLNTIWHMDAILAYDEQGTPVEPEWPEADVIVGNPPFLGSYKLRSELGDEYVDALFGLYRGRVPGSADYVCYWFERSRKMVADGKAQRAGLLATNSIRDGASRNVLDRIKASGDIFMAWDDRPWILEGASVAVSIVGFDDGAETIKYLNGKPVESIHADLTTGLDLTGVSRLEENAEICFRGDEKGGPFDISGAVARKMLDAAPNANGRPNSDVIRPYLNAMDILRRQQDRWVIDFGVDTEQEDAAFYELPFEYVVEHVRDVRKKTKSDSEPERWWLHRRPGPDMRQAISGLDRFIVVPALSKHRLFAWLSGESIPDHRLHVIARSDDYFLGVLQSRPHVLWSLRVGHVFEDRPSYNITTCFETFPFPWPPGTEPSKSEDPRVAAIAEAARELVGQRDHWLNPGSLDAKALKRRTLTNLYNDNPTWLQLAHKKLDDAVLDAYGWPHDLDDEAILERLLALNLERAAASAPDDNPET